MRRSRVVASMLVLVLVCVAIASTDDIETFGGSLLFGVGLGLLVWVAAKVAQRKGRPWALVLIPFGFAPALVELWYGLFCDYDRPSPGCEASGYVMFPAVGIYLVALLVSVAAALPPGSQQRTRQTHPDGKQSVADPVIVCWNCGGVVRGQSECPRCMAGLRPEGRGMTFQQFRQEQRLLRNRLGIAGNEVSVEDLDVLQESSPPMSLPTALASILVFAGIMLVGEMAGTWYGEIIQLGVVYVLLLAVVIYVSGTAT